MKTMLLSSALLVVSFASISTKSYAQENEKAAALKADREAELRIAKEKMNDEKRNTERYTEEARKSEQKSNAMQSEKETAERIKTEGSKAMLTLNKQQQEDLARVFRAYNQNGKSDEASMGVVENPEEAAARAFQRKQRERDEQNLMEQETLRHQDKMKAESENAVVTDKKVSELEAIFAAAAAGQTSLVAQPAVVPKTTTEGLDQANPLTPATQPAPATQPSNNRPARSLYEGAPSTQPSN